MTRYPSLPFYRWGRVLHRDDDASAHRGKPSAKERVTPAFGGEVLSRD